MTLNLLVDGDSMARTQPEGRLSPAQLDSALSSMVTLLGKVSVKVMVVISSAFAEALGSTQRSRFERFDHGSLVVAPTDLHFRDFLIRAANDGSAIIVSNNAFTRQKDLYPWLAEPGSGRHVLARQSTTSSSWDFVEARPAGGHRRSLAELLDRAPLAAPTFPAPSGPSILALQPGDDSAVEGTVGEELTSDSAKDGNHDGQLHHTAPAASSKPSTTRRSRPASKTPRKAQANTQRTKEQ